MMPVCAGLDIYSIAVIKYFVKQSNKVLVTLCISSRAEGIIEYSLMARKKSDI